jgi:lipopolysaccharide export system protein LptA
MRFLLPLLLAAGPALGQGADITLGGLRQDTSLPVEVTADALSIDQQSGRAVFTGNVVIGQGTMRLSAPRVLVVYLEDQSGIEELRASGGVVLVSGEDAAEAREADYNLQSGMIVLRGDVLLLQGDNAISSEAMTVNTNSGTARMSGRVRTLLQPEQETQ